MLGLSLFQNFGYEGCFPTVSLLGLVGSLTPMPDSGTDLHGLVYFWTQGCLTVGQIFVVLVCRWTQSLLTLVADL